MTPQPTLPVLERAIENDELVLFYQPKVSLLSGDIIGAEALVRWNVGQGDIIPPAVFLPLAEESGLLHDITVRLLDQIVQASVELEAIRPGLALSINVAPNDLQSHTISNHIKSYLDQGTIHYNSLQIEITESEAMGNFDSIRDDLFRLTGMGIKVLMDDFGTGHSSIDRLSQLPFSALKLDQGVVKRMGTSGQNLDVVKSSISMARELRMTSVAEGVESAATYNFLMAHGCEEAQGFYISHPLAMDDFIAFASKEHRFAGSQIGRIHQTVHNVLHYRKSLFDVLSCEFIGAQACLPSVITPQDSTALEHSRIGAWYFGAGQQLSGLPQFDSLENPIKRLHTLGRDILHPAGDAMTKHAQTNKFELLNDVVNEIVTGLHALESTLLLKVDEPT